MNTRKVHGYLFNCTVVFLLLLAMVIPAHAATTRIDLTETTSSYTAYSEDSIYIYLGKEGFLKSYQVTGGSTTISETYYPSSTLYSDMSERSNSFQLEPGSYTVQVTVEGFSLTTRYTSSGYQSFAEPNGSTSTRTISLTVRPTVNATGVSLNRNTLELYTSTKAGLVATVTPENTTNSVSWSSSDTSVARVDANGRVSAVAPGTATITVSVGNFSDSCTVTVSELPSGDVLFAGGTGTESDPYIITTKEQLNFVRFFLSDHYRLEADILFTQEDFAETGDFYTDGCIWEPIGKTDYAAFTGSLDGNGHRIDGLKIEMSSSSGEYAGLFGYMTGGEIKDLEVTNCAVAVDTYASDAYAGGIVGFAEGVRITNCSTTGTVEASASSADYSSSYAYAGGIAGGADDSTTLTGCTNAGTVSSNSYAGGIVGTGGTVTDCENSGSISALYAGGIAGTGETVSSCRNTGPVSGTRNAGGILGRGATVTDCYNEGSVTATYTSGFFGAYAGGIAGSADTVSRCYNVGAVFGTDGAGGIAASVTTVSDCYNTGNIFGNDVGGIVSAPEDSTITSCYNAGRIVAVQDDSSYPAYAGGIAGDTGSSTTTITGCYYLDCIGIGVGNGTDTATSCTLDQMKQQDTFEGFDFDETWVMNDDRAYPLPVLQNLPHAENAQGGSGTLLDPYQITTTEQLHQLRNDMKACYILMNDIVFTEADFAEGGAFYNGGAGWQPIGAYTSDPFYGCLDGNGNIISGLKIDIHADDAVYAGLFSYIRCGEVKNLGMEDCSISAATSASSGSVYLGSISGCGGNITNCYNTGTVSAASDDYYVAAGGIVGRGGTVIHCYNTGSVTATSGTKTSYAGGISGEVGNTSYCYNTGSVTASSDSYGAHAGGIIGYRGSADHCYNTGSVTIAETDTTYITNAGGIVGFAYSDTVTNCYNAGTVSGGIMGGGIAGNTYRDNTFTNCYNTGSVSGSYYGGGIVGYLGSDATATISSCYNVGAVSGQRYSPGGILGYVSIPSAATLTDCYYLNTSNSWIGNSTSKQNQCTLEQMKQQDTYVGFDFDTVWTMTGDENYLLPRLQSVDMVQIHRYTNYVSDHNATCTEDGTKTAVCDFCNHTDTISDEGSAPGHEYEDGHCIRCGEAAPLETTPMYRLYNQYTNEHLFLTNPDERTMLVNAGWTDEGIGWMAATVGNEVYRLYNPYGDFHFYTKSWEEVQTLLPLGWSLDGPVSCDAGEDGVPIYRLFNPYETTNYHHYTTGMDEVEFLVSLGWILEGVAWYAAN